MRLLGRLGFAGRMILIVLLSMLALITAGIGLVLVTREANDPAAARFPVPEPAAAIVALLDNAPATERQRIVRAVSSPDLKLTIAATASAVAGAESRMPGVEWLVAEFLENPNREVLVYRHVQSRFGLLGRLFDRASVVSRTPVTIAIRLADGQFALIEVRGATTRQLFGIPLGFWIGIIGFLLAALAVWAISREARPLGALAEAAHGFGRDGKPRPVNIADGASEIRSLVGAFNGMQARIAALIESRALLLGAISHDVRTLLTRLRLRVEDIPDTAGRDKAIRDVDDMTAMMDDALAVARSSAVSDRRETVHLAALAADVTAEEPRAKLVDGDIRPSRARVSGDPIALRRVLRNLIDNAGRHGTRVEVRLVDAGRDVSIQVDDDGPGIPEAEREMVFEPLYRTERSRNRATGGNGLGLAITRQIVEAHGGRIAAGASPLGGARLEVTLPLFEPANRVSRPL